MSVEKKIDEKVGAAFVNLALRSPLVCGFVICSLHSVFVDIERHTSEPGVPASGVNSLRTFHAGKVVALACLRPLSTEIGDVSGGVLITGGTGVQRRTLELQRRRLQ